MKLMSSEARQRARARRRRARGRARSRRLAAVGPVHGVDVARALLRHLRRHDLGGHVRDPAQHHRREGARATARLSAPAGRSPTRGRARGGSTARTDAAPCPSRAARPCRGSARSAGARRSTPARGCGGPSGSAAPSARARRARRGRRPRAARQRPGAMRWIPSQTFVERPRSSTSQSRTNTSKWPLLDETKISAETSPITSTSRSSTSLV